MESFGGTVTRTRTAHRALILVGAGLALAAGLVLLAATAAAEPYMTVREGYKCSKCHVNRTGGGKRTDYAQVYMHTRLAQNSVYAEQDGGKKAPAAGSFASGRLSQSFSIGADIRTSLAHITPDTGDASLGFNRPSGCEGSCHSSGGGGKLAEIQMQFDVLPEKAVLVATQNLQPTVGPRELFALVGQLPFNGYVKTGTFRLPNGLQSTHDDPFAHGTHFKGSYTPGVDPVRGTGVEVGVEPGMFSVSLSLTNPKDRSAVPDDLRQGLMAYGVTKLGTLGLLYFNDPLSETVKRTVLGSFAGLHFGRFTAQAQFSEIKESDSAGATEAIATTAQAELNYLITKGRNLKLLYEFTDPDKDTGGDLVDRLSLIYEPFTTPYFQWRVGYRDYTGPVDVAETNFNVVFVESHFLF